MKPIPWLGAIFPLLAGHAHAAVTATILAGGKTDLPGDMPSGRLDAAGEFSFPQAPHAAQTFLVAAATRNVCGGASVSAPMR